MKRILFLLLLACSSTSLLFAQQETASITDPRLAIKLTTEQGDSLSLESLKGKVVLLDFWASWCGPCRASNMYMKKTYKKFHTDGFEVFAVSLDEDRKSWLKAVRSDKIDWIQVSGDRMATREAAFRWGVQSIPTSFLINKKGIVVGINLEGKELEKAIRELLTESN